MANEWPVGTVVMARVVIIDGGPDMEPWIVAQPGDLGIIVETHSDVACEVRFPGGRFTTGPADAALGLYPGLVEHVCDGGPVHPAQRFTGNLPGPVAQSQRDDKARNAKRKAAKRATRR